MKKYIAGVDEVGRGSLIGPVCAAAVILKKNITKESYCARYSDRPAPRY